MNLGIEYALRSGELEHHVEFPLSLFLVMHPTREKRVVTVHERSDGRLGVTTWFLSDCWPDHVLPRCERQVIDRVDLLSSPHTVVPLADPVQYVEGPHRPRSRSPYLPFTRTEQKEYESDLARFLFSDSHARARADWLWEAFQFVHPDLGGVATPADSTEAVIQSKAPWLRGPWLAWRLHLLDHNRLRPMVAAELLFQAAYDRKREVEKRKTTTPWGWPVGSAYFPMLGAGGSWTTTCMGTYYQSSYTTL